MDNTISGLVGVGLFLVFIIGLTESIGALPFAIIVFAVCAMAVYDLYESIRDARQEAAKKAASGSAAD